MRILLLEDDVDVSNWVIQSLMQVGHVIDHLTNGKDALLSATINQYDVIILDRMTPELDGLSVLKALRAAKNVTPILFLTALGTIEDRVEGLEAGADDYLTKPFAISELTARVAALGRRKKLPNSEGNHYLDAKNIKLDLFSRQCIRFGKVIDLKNKEFAILEILLKNRGRIMTKNMMLERVWSMHFEPGTSVVETHVSRLRAKIEKPFNDIVIKTVRGAGYVIE